MKKADMRLSRGISFQLEEIEVMKPDGENVCVTVKGIWDDEGNQMESAPHPKQKLWIDLGVELDRFDILRRKEME